MTSLGEFVEIYRHEKSDLIVEYAYDNKGQLNYFFTIGDETAQLSPEDVVDLMKEIETGEK